MSGFCASLSGLNQLPFSSTLPEATSCFCWSIRSSARPTLVLAFGVVSSSWMSPLDMMRILSCCVDVDREIPVVATREKRSGFPQELENRMRRRFTQGINPEGVSLQSPGLRYSATLGTRTASPDEPRRGSTTVCWHASCGTPSEFNILGRPLPWVAEYRNPGLWSE